MKKNFLIYSSAALMLASCANEEFIESPVEKDAILYGVTAAPSTRAENSFCNTNLPGQFSVYAAKNGTAELYMDGDIVRGAGNPMKYTADVNRYWPEYALDFVAQVNGGTSFSYNEGTPQFQNFKVPGDVAKQKDLLYAVKNNQSRQTVKLNFRHALSQIVFRAQNSSNLNVEVSGVSVGNIHTQGTYTFPTGNTDPVYENHTDNPAGEFNGNRGSWAGVEDSQSTKYDVTFPAVTVGAEAVELTGISHTGGVDNSLLLLPQTVEAWNPAVTGADYNGAYFLVKVKMTYKDNGKTVYDNYAAVPVNVEWQEGVRYIYTFKFIAGGNGGYTPDPTNPLPVLEGITYDVTTDDFIPVGSDKDMNTGNEVKLNEAYVACDNGVDALPANSNFKGQSTSDPVNVTLGAAPVRDGYKFVNWTDAAGNTFVPGNAVSVAAGETFNLTAVWEKEIKDITYRVNFMANPKDADVEVGNMITPDYWEITVPETTESYEYTIPDNELTHGNWTFKGWSEKQTAYADDTFLAPGEKITLTKENPVVTLYAQWAVKFTTGDTPGAGGTGWGN